MIQTSNSLTFTVPLSFEAHSLAQECRKQLSAPNKAKQVYLNTLAVYAVEFYLRCLGFKTDVEHSDSRNPICLKFMDVADLLVEKLGKLECRPILPDAKVFQIPPEVRADRIGYVAVQLNRSLKQATILGFTPTAVAEVPLSQLRSLAEFPEYLNRIRQVAPTQKVAVNLRNWFENAFEEGWQAFEAILGNQKTLAVVRETTQSRLNVKRAKLLDLGMQLGEQSVALAIAISQNDDETVKVLVQIHPSRPQTYLPSNLRLLMLNDTNETLQEVRSRSQDNYIQLKRFEGQIGDSFKIRVALNEISITEDFIF
ncbi:DUF1822 family protein [Candidatus Gracilibacteria bacterium]|nr:DUF1822 family protein [Candidatus Gracilibacteria bacterium]NJM90201.1 DUF1822 family protein [Hydrococcus sp. RU_2_2]NJP22046.1 DUF1822 family protein [Hydrococcus sp. CRU_1_1]